MEEIIYLNYVSLEHYQELVKLNLCRHGYRILKNVTKPRSKNLNIEKEELASVLILLFQSVFLGIYAGAFDVSAQSYFLEVFTTVFFVGLDHILDCAIWSSVLLANSPNCGGCATNSWASKSISKPSPVSNIFSFAFNQRFFPYSYWIVYYSACVFLYLSLSFSPYSFPAPS